RINSLGEMLFSIQTSQGFALLLAKKSNGGQALKVMFAGDLICGGGAILSSLFNFPSAALNDAGTYTFAEQIGAQSAICIGSEGGAPTKITGSGAAAPAVIGGTLGFQTSPPLGINASGDILFTSPI